MAYNEGQTATNPQTGEKIVFQGGQWQPVPTAQQAPPAQPPAFIPGTVSPARQAAEQRAQQDQAMQQQTTALQNQLTELNIEEKRQKLGDGEAADQAASAANARDKLVRLIERMDGVYADVLDSGGWGETGMTGKAMRGISGTAAFDLKQDVNTLQANFAFDALQAMRDASKTGGALGSITERELELLQSTVASLDPNQSQDNFIRNLAVAKGAYLDKLRQIDPAAADELENRGNPQRDQSGVITYDERGREAMSGMPPPTGGGGGGPGDTFLDQLGTGAAVTLKGAGKVATGLWDLGMDAAAGVQRGINYGIGEGGGALLDAVGAPQTADALRAATERTDASLANMPTASGALDKIYATPEGYEPVEFASSIAAGLMLPGPKAARPVRAPSMNTIATPARDIVQAGKDAGVRVMTSDVRPPTTFTGKIARATGERIPYAGTGGPRAAQQEERVQAVKDLARDFGADVGDSYLDDIAADLAKTRGGQLTALTKAKDAVIDGVQGAFVAPRTVQAIDQEIARLRGIDEGSFAPVIQRLEAFKANIQSGKSLREVEGNRKLLGDLFQDPNLASIRGDGQKAINAIYGPLRDDMAAFIRQSAGDEAYNKWASANKRLATLAGELDVASFKSVLKSAETTPENVARLLASKKPSEVQRLYRNLSPEGKAKARAGIIHMAVEKAGGIDNISPDRFANAIAQNSRAAGVVFEGADLQRLQGLERLLKATKQAGVASAAPPTGVQNSQMIGGFVAGSTGPVSIPVLATMGGLARLYESPATRNLLIGLSKTKPGSEAEGQWIQRIMKAAASQTERMGNAANDIVGNSPSRAAAAEDE